MNFKRELVGFVIAMTITPVEKGVADLKKDNAYMYIKNRILDREWDIGSAINVNEICQVLNMSRTPVLEAISRLEREGFLSIIPQVGAFVRRPASSELFERLLMRGSLEALMVEWAARKIEKTQLDMIDAVLRRMEEPGISIVDYANLNRDFHRIIHEASGLSYIQGLVEEHWDFFEYAAALDKVFKEHQMARSLLEHRMIFHSLKDGNSTLAKQLMEQHVVRVAYLVKEESG